MSMTPPLALYVHIPWCVRKCPYCDFNSHALRKSLPENDYVTALIADLDSALPQIAGRPLVSLFFGGGTPSLLSGGAIDAILTAVRDRVPLAQDAEITLEANPGATEAEKFAAFRAAGVNRLSLGIQSFNPAHLQALGRIHDEHQAKRAIELAMHSFDNVNLDLMYGLPGQTLDQALLDLDQALAFAPTHLSCYQLTIEPETVFATRPPALDPDLCADMQELIEAKLAAAGYVNYETSAFAKPGRQCRHNLNYWTFGDYLGIGAGAHGKLTLANDADLASGHRILRQARWKQPAQYMAQVAAGHPYQEAFTVDGAELPFEFMMNALRLNQGFEMPLFSERTRLPPERIEAQLRQAIADGLLEREADHIRPTRRGRRFLNRLLEQFLP